MPHFFHSHTNGMVAQNQRQGRPIRLQIQSKSVHQFKKVRVKINEANKISCVAIIGWQIGNFFEGYGECPGLILNVALETCAFKYSGGDDTVLMMDQAKALLVSLKLNQQH